MEFYDVIRTRRSVRSYRGQAVPAEVLERVLNAARIAPSGNNGQPWSFVVVKEEERKRRIASACYDQAFIAQAPVVVVCCAQRYPGRFEPWLENIYLADAVIAIDHLVLAARNEGLGSCWIGAIRPAAIKEALNIPEEVDVLMVLPLGYPTSPSAFTEECYRKPLKEICFLEAFGNPMIASKDSKKA